VLISSQTAGRERIKIVDFGLAKISRLDPSNPQILTIPGTVLGTFAYMSPEQVLGEEADERSDIFSLGVTVVEALTGHRPFLGCTSAELIAAILHASFHLPGEAPEIERLDRVLQKCLAKDRKQRFASVSALHHEAIPAIEQCPLFAPTATSSKPMLNSEDATGTLPIT
jgi:serine/threonine protein kinase